MVKATHVVQKLSPTDSRPQCVSRPPRQKNPLWLKISVVPVALPTVGNVSKMLSGSMPLLWTRSPASEMAEEGEEVVLPKNGPGECCLYCGVFHFLSVWVPCPCQATSSMRMGQHTAGTLWKGNVKAMESLNGPTNSITRSHCSQQTCWCSTAVCHSSC